MTGPRRRVRATPGFFHQLDQLLPAERSGAVPSRADFEALELLPAVEEFATGFDDLPPLIAGRPGYRVLINPGRLVLAYTIVGQLAPDGAIGVVDVDIDLHPPAVADDETDPPDPTEERRDDDLRVALEWLASGTCVGLEDLLLSGAQPVRRTTEEICSWLGWA